MTPPGSVQHHPSTTTIPGRPGGATRGGGTLRVLQLTDTHLTADPHGSLLGQRTRNTFEAVLELAKASFWPPDLILLTGDLVHDEVPETYRYLDRRMSNLGVPFLAIPGNHDRPDLLAEILDSDGDRNVRQVSLGGWQLILLDSTIAGEDGGRLSQSQLEAVDQGLASQSGPALVCLHHQPVPVGSAWLDAIGVCNGNELLSVLSRHERVRGILWGHIHQEYCAYRQGLCLLGSPSTCVQFQPGSHSFALDDRTPGYRWLLLHADGQIETGISRLAAYPDPLEIDAGGY